MIRVPIELDHVFICTAPGAPAAEELVRLGLREGPPNTHPGQGTANRRFFFANAMLELLWVSNEADAKGPNTRRTLLWERWSGRERSASPFGICLRPMDAQDVPPPFPGWEYRPAYLPDSMSIHIGEGGILEPMWFYLRFMRRGHREQQFIEHAIGVREITSITLTTPVSMRSRVAQMIVESGILGTQFGARSLIEIEFDHSRQGQSVDLRPHLPLALRL
jgi:Glyoxalase-like domain